MAISALAPLATDDVQPDGVLRSIPTSIRLDDQQDDRQLPRLAMFTQIPALDEITLRPLSSRILPYPAEVQWPVVRL
jgi:hypothetical protein